MDVSARGSLINTLMLHDSVYVRVFVLVCKGGHGGVPDTDRHGPK